MKHVQFVSAVFVTIAASTGSIEIFNVALVALLAAVFAEKLLGQEKGNYLTMANIITDEQKIMFKFVPKTAKGNPAKVDGVPVWSVSSEEGLALTVEADGLSATAKAVGALGDFQVIVKADADLGEGVRELTGLADVTVIAAEAASIGLEASAPELA